MKIEDYAQAIAAELHLLHAYVHEEQYRVPITRLIKQIVSTDELKKDCVSIMQRQVK